MPFFAPAETVPHERTWMAWPARRDVWGARLQGFRDDVAAVARAIARYEHVALVVRPDQAKEAQRACGPSVETVGIDNDDLWIRDMGPVFVVDGEGGLAGVDLNFNGWGGKQVHDHDRLVARRVLEWLGVERIEAPFVAEGGALVVDGRGTVMATESSIVNANRNPGKAKAVLTSEILEVLGATTMLWVKGLADHDITDDHIDATARFVDAATVVVNQHLGAPAGTPWAVAGAEALHTLERSTNSSGERLTCVTSCESPTVPPGADPATFVRSYVNWYVGNGAVFIPAFSDPASDRAAYDLAERLYPQRSVVQLRIDAIASGGGGIHCATQEQPSVAP